MAHRNGKLCICEICNCGRHHCPHRPQRTGPYGDCTLSEYNNKYVAHPIEPTRSMKPPANVVHSDGPLSDETTHRMDYITHALERPFHHQPDLYRPPQGDMESTSMYMKDFIERKGERQGPIVKEQKKIILGPFEGEPTYRTDYRKWELPRAEHGKANQQWTPPRDPFEGSPTYTTDYISHRIEMQPSFKPAQAVRNSDAPFEGVTDYRQSYISHPLEMKEAKKKTEWSRPQASFEGLTTFQRDFTAKEPVKLSSYKPLAVPLHSKDPLQDETTMRNDYKTWEISRPHLHQNDPYRKPEGEMEMSTTYFRDYHDHPLVKQAQLRQKERKRDGNVPFEGNTDYRENFRPWGVGPREKAGPKNEYESPQIPFEGQSTFQSHFVPHPIDQRRSYKPEGRANLSTDPFDDHTIYRMDYTQKEISPCPAALINTPRSNFVFKEEDSTGHMLYEPTLSKPEGSRRPLAVS